MAHKRVMRQYTRRTPLKKRFNTQVDFVANDIETMKKKAVMEKGSNEKGSKSR